MKTLLVQADSLKIPLADGSVHCVVTSPPYWGLRAYSTGEQKHAELGSEPLHDCLGWATGNECGACFVCHMVAVFREVWRVMRDDGCCWVNIGDSYNGSGGAGGDYAPGGLKAGQPKFSGRNGAGLKSKDLCLVPQRLALALQADGWYVRSEIIWAKKAPMPESVTDRPTKSHEQIWLLTKAERYWYDADAVRESAIHAGEIITNNAGKNGDMGKFGATRTGFMKPGGVTVAAGRNQRDVWHLGPEPFAGAHFATFPTEIPRRCIKAGCPVGGVVLDPFNGAGTTGLVCQELNRRYIGTDLSGEYLRMSRDRLGHTALEAWQNGTKASVADLSDLPMFAAREE